MYLVSPVLTAGVQTASLVTYSHNTLYMTVGERRALVAEQWLPMGQAKISSRVQANGSLVAPGLVAQWQARHVGISGRL